MSEPKIVALLPMKAHSSRVPHKNFRPLAGKPLFRWILDALTEVPEISQVVINTDARQELKVAGLEPSERVLIRDRREEICGDHVSMNLVLKDDVDAVPADLYLMTHTTNPFISASTISAAIEKYRHEAKSGVDSLFTVNRFQTRFYREDASPVNHDPENLIPTQELEPWYEENSCLYLFTAKSFLSTDARIGRKPVMFQTPHLESVDIDTPDDWKLAELLAGHFSC